MIEFKIEDNKLENFLNNYSKDIPLVLYGYGGGIIDLPQLFMDYGIKIVAICDRDKEKQGSYYCGIPIISFEDVLEKYDEFNVYISVSNYFEEIEEYLKKYISSDRIFAFGRKKNMSVNEYKNFISTNKTKLEKIYNGLSDNVSKKTMENIINGTLSNDLKYFKEVYCNNQYFPDNIINLSEEEVFVDAGAFNGDTISEFMKRVDNKFEKIYGFEPDDNSFNKLLEMKDANVNSDKIEVVKAGVYNSTTFIGFNDDVSKGSRVETEKNSGNKIKVVSLDDYINSKVTFIKMDVEGCELEALHGAVDIIKKYRPKLAVCIYHKQEDILNIPQFIMDLNLDYKYYMRHHTHSVDETVFYAI